MHTDVLILNLGAGFTFVTFNNPKYKHHLYYYSFSDSGIWLGFIKSCPSRGPNDYSVGSHLHILDLRCSAASINYRVKDQGFTTEKRFPQRIRCDRWYPLPPHRDAATVYIFGLTNGHLEAVDTPTPSMIALVTS